jgi:fibrillarin-like pre-rRNA processing protein
LTGFYKEYAIDASMEPLSFTSDRVFLDRGRLYTISACPGKRVYGERLFTLSGTEYREWDPRRSKLAAYLTVGGKQFPFKKDSKVLYLGASSGTTPSHVADICSEGKVYCVEFAQRMFRELVVTSETRPNMMPILGDATRPEEYSMFTDRVDIVYQDVAQKMQAKILCDNMDAFNAEFGMMAVKARSEDVTASPDSIFKDAERALREMGFSILDDEPLEPFEKAHAMIAVKRD